MPKLDGLGCARCVRTAIQTTPFIMLTGRADRTWSARGAVRNNYLVKPFTVAVLREKIEAVFGVLT